MEMQWNKLKLNWSMHEKPANFFFSSWTPVCVAEEGNVCEVIDSRISPQHSRSVRASRCTWEWQQSLWLLMIVGHSWTGEELHSLGSGPAGSGPQMRRIFSGDLWLSSSWSRHVFLWAQQRQHCTFTLVSFFFFFTVYRRFKNGKRFSSNRQHK